VDRRATELTENDVVGAVCCFVQHHGWRIESRASTTERGVDVVARSPNGALLRVEAKGATSSKAGTARRGKSFTPAQIKTHVSRAFFTAAASVGPATARRPTRSAMALPETQHHRLLIDQIHAALAELEIGVFWVQSLDAVRLDAPWQL
jgi:hypothetical protein